MRRIVRLAITVAACVDAALLCALAAYCAVGETLRKPVQPATKVVRRVPSEWIN